MSKPKALMTHYELQIRLRVKNIITARRIRNRLRNLIEIVFSYVVILNENVQANLFL